MHIGDKVRLLHGNEEGVITGFLPGNIIEVEIEMGFVIPVLKSEAVVVAKEEALHFRKETDESKQKKEQVQAREEAVSEKGIYFSFISINEQETALHLVNNTDYILLYSISEISDPNVYGIAEGRLEQKAFVKIKNYSLQNFEKWPSFLVQLLFHRSGYFAPRESFAKRIKFNASTFYKKKGESPLIGKKGFIFQIDEEHKPLHVDPAKLRESFYKSSPAQAVQKPRVESVDLHIEKLVPDHSGLSHSDILEVQLKAFRQALDDAIISGQNQITFIHGVGKGALKQAIQKELSGMKNIRYFKDAMKEKFGYGATLVQIK